MKKSSPKGKATRKAKRSKRRPFPYAKVAVLWSEGKTIAEIAKAIGRVGEGKDPHHALRVVLTRMHHGYKDEDGKIVKLPHRISRKILRLSKKAGLRAQRS